MSDEYNVEYTFYAKSRKHPIYSEFPDEQISISFDGTDCLLDTMLEKFKTFLRAAGYVFDDIEVVRNSDVKPITDHREDYVIE